MKNPYPHQKAHLVTEIPGPQSREWRQKEDQFLAPGLQNFAILAGITVKEAKGSTVTDLDGNIFLDLIGGIGVNGLGHSHPRMIRAIQEQVEKASVGSFTSLPRVELLSKLSGYFPRENEKEIGRVQLYSSGAEAVESALRLAKSYTKKYEFVSFWGGFHGKTMGALSLMGSDFKSELGPMVPGSHIVPYADCYRCPLGLKLESCGMACVEMARKELKVKSAGEIAAFIIEPMQGTAGNIIPPRDFLPAVHELAKEMEALLISDEMITGFGRTGKFWGVDHSSVKPDIVTMGKQFGGGFPISGLMAKDEITQSKPWGNPSGSSSSYGGNPLGSAAALEACKIIEEDDLIENSRKMGEYFLGKLRSFPEKFPMVGFVDGQGLMLRVELVKDQKTKEPLPKKVTMQIFQECVKRGLLTMSYSPHFRIQPSMTIDSATIDEMVNILEDVFQTASKW